MAAEPQSISSSLNSPAFLNRWATFAIVFELLLSLVTGSALALFLLGIWPLDVMYLYFLAGANLLGVLLPAFYLRNDVRPLAKQQVRMVFTLLLGTVAIFCLAVMAASVYAIFLNAGILAGNYPIIIAPIALVFFLVSTGFLIRSWFFSPEIAAETLAPQANNTHAVIDYLSLKEKDDAYIKAFLERLHRAGYRITILYNTPMTEPKNRSTLYAIAYSRLSALAPRGSTINYLMPSISNEDVNTEVAMISAGATKANTKFFTSIPQSDFFFDAADYHPTCLPETANSEMVPFLVSNTKNPSKKLVVVDYNYVTRRKGYFRELFTALKAMNYVPVVYILAKEEKLAPISPNSFLAQECTDWVQQIPETLFYQSSEMIGAHPSFMDVLVDRIKRDGAGTFEKQDVIFISDNAVYAKEAR